METISKDFFNVVDIWLKGKCHDLIAKSKLNDCIGYKAQYDNGDEKIKYPFTRVLIWTGKVANRRQKKDIIKSMQVLFKGMKLEIIGVPEYHEKITISIQVQEPHPGGVEKETQATRLEDTSL